MLNKLIFYSLSSPLLEVQLPFKPLCPYVGWWVVWSVFYNSLKRQGSYASNAPVGDFVLALTSLFMFIQNEERFGLKTSYDPQMSAYTTTLNKDRIDG